jgi:hypothetical protein
MFDATMTNKRNNIKILWHCGLRVTVDHHISRSPSPGVQCGWLFAARQRVYFIHTCTHAPVKARKILTDDAFQYYCARTYKRSSGNRLLCAHSLHPTIALRSSFNTTTYMDRSGRVGYVARCSECILRQEPTQRSLL